MTNTYLTPLISSITLYESKYFLFELYSNCSEFGLLPKNIHGCRNLKTASKTCTWFNVINWSLWAQRGVSQRRVTAKNQLFSFQLLSAAASLPFRAVKWVKSLCSWEKSKKKNINLDWSKVKERTTSLPLFAWGDTVSHHNL